MIGPAAIGRRRDLLSGPSNSRRPANRRAALWCYPAVDGITKTVQSRGMTGDRIPSLIMQIADELRVRGVSITCLAGEWRVNFRGGTDATAYVTDDLQDAFDHGRAMALAGPPVPAAPGINGA
jgi:hypothetical protein